MIRSNALTFKKVIGVKVKKIPQQYHIGRFFIFHRVYAKKNHMREIRESEVRRSGITSRR